MIVVFYLFGSYYGKARNSNEEVLFNESITLCTKQSSCCDCTESGILLIRQTDNDARSPNRFVLVCTAPSQSDIFGKYFVVVLSLLNLCELVIVPSKLRSSLSQLKS